MQTENKPLDSLWTALKSWFKCDKQKKDNLTFESHFDCLWLSDIKAKIPSEGRSSVTVSLTLKPGDSSTERLLSGSLTFPPTCSSAVQVCCIQQRWCLISLQRCQAACCTIHATCLTGVSLSRRPLWDGRSAAVYGSQPTQSLNLTVWRRLFLVKPFKNLFDSWLTTHFNIISSVFVKSFMSLKITFIYYLESACVYILDIFAFIRQ